MTALLERRLRPATAAPFRTLLSDTGRDVAETTAALAAGKIGPDEWHGILLETLAEAHAQAGYLGRLRAGDRAAFDQDDRRFGQLVAQEEMPFLDAFRDDIQGGRYLTDSGDLDVQKVGSRANLYLTRLSGTANEALALTAPDDETWNWLRGKDDSCEDCVRLEEGSPYPHLPPTLPRMNQTRCYGNCGCRCVSSGGLETFNPE